MLKTFIRVRMPTSSTPFSQNPRTYPPNLQSFDGCETELIPVIREIPVAREEPKLLRERKASGSSIGAEGTIRRESDKQ